MTKMLVVWLMTAGLLVAAILAFRLSRTLLVSVMAWGVTLATVALRFIATLTTGLLRLIGRVLATLVSAAGNSVTDDAPPTELAGRLIGEQQRVANKRELTWAPERLYQIEPARAGSFWKWTGINLRVVILGQLAEAAGFAKGATIAIALLVCQLVHVSPEFLQKYRYRYWLRNQGTEVR